MNRYAIIALTAAAMLGAAAVAQRQLGYKDTPTIPGMKYRVHDGERPQPRVVDPGTPSTQEKPGTPPSDAVVLFDGKDLAQWRGDQGDAKWKVENGYMEVAPRSGSIHTRQEFGDCQLHLEFASPNPPSGIDQGRGNSGVLFFGRYEIQILDSYENQTYPDGQAAAIYGQFPPLVNASRKPGEWQTYDILFTAPRFKDGQLESPAYVTVLHNGVVVHNHTALLGAVAFRSIPRYSPHGEKGAITLQNHGNPVRFRNIWIRELKGYDEP